MDIDTTAPLHARREIFITAPLEKVWQLQTDIDRWHEWQTDVASAILDGKLAAGTTFHWKAMGLGITSQLHTVEPPHRVGWTGDSLGMHAIHNWTFEPHANGTRVITQESLSGWMPRLLKLFDAKFLEKSLDKSLQILKARAERTGQT